jgi:signal transduction histidine kinase
MADYSALAEGDPVGRVVVRDDAFVYVNPRFATLVDAAPGTLHGRDPREVFDGADVFALDDATDDAAAVADREGGSDAVRRVTLRGADRAREATLHLSRIDYEGESAVLGVVVPLDDAEPRAVSVLERATADLVGATSRDEVCTVAVETAAETFDPDAVGVYSLDDGRLVPTVSRDAAALAGLDPADGPLWEPFRRGEARVVPAADHDLAAALALLVVPLGDHGVLVAAADAGRLPAADAEIVRLLATNVRAALDRVRREERLARLHEATRSLMRAETETDVAEVAVATARDVLSHDICGVHLYDPARDALVPVAASERTREFLGDGGSLPALERGTSLAFDAFEAGETRVYGRINQTPGVMDPTTPVRSELIVPLGDRGVFLAGSVVPDQFDETDVSLARVLCANVESALERAEREETLRDQEAELRERNARLDEFASVVSHDLRNPLNVAQGRLELAREACTCDAATHLDTVAESHRRMAELVDDLLTLARQGRGAGDTEPVDLASLARTCWEGLDGEFVVVDDLTVEADRSRLRELVENLLRNAVEHAGPTPTVRIGALAGGAEGEDGGAGADGDEGDGAGADGDEGDGAGADGDEGDGAGADGDEGDGAGGVERKETGGGFFVEDDGPGIPPEDRERVFEHGYSTDADGTGFGLSIVGAVADAHGWEMRVTEGDEGGARFEFRF